MKLLTKILIALPVFFLFFFLYNSVLFPAYLSTVYGCNTQSTILKDNGYVLSAVFTTSPIEENSTHSLESGANCSTEGTPKIIYYQNYDKKTQKHELVHYYQFINRRLYSCDHPYLKFFNEVEAYFSSYLPDFIYNRIY